MRFCALQFTVTIVVLLVAVPTVEAQSMSPRYYKIGTPVLVELWVDPQNGNDSNGGSTRADAVRSLTEAWSRIPSGTSLTGHGYRILLVRGDHTDVPVYWESRYGTHEYPILIQAADGKGTAGLPALNIFDCRYLYLIGLNIHSDGGDVFHCERCDHLLIRKSKISGSDPESFAVQETLKINQSRYIYVERSDISGGWDNAVDLVAVQYGHFQKNKIHNAGDWCMYLKGGSAYFRVEANEYYDCGTGGFTAGQGTGFEFMETPWLHYEAYDIKFINNVIHHTFGAGMGVNGGYNILMAYNTLYRIGMNSHVFESVFGARGCDGNTSECRLRLNAGGWGTTKRNNGSNEEPIPDRNVFVYNNIFYNPDGVKSQWQHFAVPGPQRPSSGSNIPSPSRTDDNLQIRGNVIWNGPRNHPLGIEGSDAGCQNSNQACNERQLFNENSINTVEPELVNPERRLFRPVPGGNLFGVTTYDIPAFAGGDRPQPPLSPDGVPGNSVARDRRGKKRSASAPPGAYRD